MHIPQQSVMVDMGMGDENGVNFRIFPGVKPLDVRQHTQGEEFFMRIVGKSSVIGCLFKNNG